MPFISTRKVCLNQYLMSGRFRPAAVWDPILIISNIACIQCCYYALFGFQILAMSLFLTGGVRHPPLEAIFDSNSLQVGDSTGRLLIYTWIMNSFCVALVIWKVVGRSRLCLDFCATVFFYHALITWLASGFPTTLFWMTHLVALIISTVLSEYLCIRTEMAAITLAVTGSKSDV